MSILRKLYKTVTPITFRRLLRRRVKALVFHGPYISPPSDFRGLIEDPVSALKRANGSRVIIDVPLSCCRSFKELGYEVTLDSCNPYVMTIRWARDMGRDSYKGSPMEMYYTIAQPAHGAEKLGIDSSKLREYPPLYVEVPWRSAPGEHVYQRRLKTVKREVSAFSKSLSQEEVGTFSTDLSIKDGWRHYGPMSDSMGCFEVRRLMHIYNSISANGYSVKHLDDHITGNLMLRENGHWSVLIDNGNHRIAAMANLQYKKVPIIINPSQVIRRSEVHKWPAVEQGIMTVEEAKEVFDRIFEGRQPPAISAVWPP